MKRLFCILSVLLALLGTATAAESQQVLARVAFLSDTHVYSKTNSERAMLFNSHFEQVISAVNDAKVDLVLIGGDLTDNGESEQMDAYKQIAKSIKAPLLVIPGNHDVGRTAKGDGKVTITEKRLELFKKKIGPTYFAKEKAGLRVIGINSCVFGTGFEEEKKQMAFLEKELAKPASKPTLLMLHYPLVPREVGVTGDGVWNAFPEIQKRIWAWALQGGAKAVLCGHLHNYYVRKVDGIVHLSNYATAYGIPRGQEPAGWMLLTVSKDGEIKHECFTLK